MQTTRNMPAEELIQKVSRKRKKMFATPNIHTHTGIVSSNLYKNFTNHSNTNSVVSDTRTTGYSAANTSNFVSQSLLEATPAVAIT